MLLPSLTFGGGGEEEEEKERCEEAIAIFFSTESCDILSIYSTHARRYSKAFVPKGVLKQVVLRSGNYL